MIRVVVIALLLAGCSPYWVHEPALTGFTVLPVRYAAAAEMPALCAPWGDVKACAKWNLIDRTCQPVLGPTADFCNLKHETRHCERGDNHDARAQYRDNCGEDS